MSLKEVEEHIQIAAFLSTVNEPKQAKSLWEKKGTKNGLDEHIRSTAEAEKELERIQKRNEKEKTAEKSDTSKVKDEPVGKINRRKPKNSKSPKTDNRDKKERHCFRCGEPNWTPEHSKDCKARKSKCKRCEKNGHFEK